MQFVISTFFLINYTIQKKKSKFGKKGNKLVDGESCQDNKTGM